MHVIQVLIEKYGHSHKILLAGDLNASLLEDRCSRDRRLVSWCNTVGLSLSKDYPLEATHIHHRGSGSSILDYLISTDPSILDDITVMTECAENTSSHHPVSASLRISLTTGPPTKDSASAPAAHNWNRCDLYTYREIVRELIPRMDDTDRQCPEAYCETIFDTLKYAATKSTPRPKPRTRRQVWDGDVSRAMAANKAALAAWRAGDRPISGTLLEERKATKRILRQALPIHKKGKDPLSRDNYRGITITPVLSKLMEHVILSRFSYHQLQSPLQYGFTKGLSPTMAILAVTEAISDAVDRHTPLYIAALDVKKAFDVVYHPSLLHKLFHQRNVCNATWKYIKNNNLNTKDQVKLQGALSEPFTVNQGVGQGKILSTFNYKLYINNLLCQLSSSDFGSHVGTEYLGSPTCADDVILLADNIVDLQSQLKVVEDYASSTLTSQNSLRTEPVSRPPPLSMARTSHPAIC